MFWELPSWSFLNITLVFVLGGAIGYLFAQLMKDRHTRLLEQELDASRQQLVDYREDVKRHFLKTSALFDKLSDDYREIYDHLAGGAQVLCNEQTVAPKAFAPQQEVVPGTAMLMEEDIRRLSREQELDAYDRAPASYKGHAPKGLGGANAQHRDARYKTDDNHYSTGKHPASGEGADDDVHLGEESAPAILRN
jgi:uncharacterized membrane-anchored protein YhcB (DUF1043 family)